MARNLQEIISAFFVGPNGQPLTPEQARTRQELAESLLAKATDTSPTAGGWTSVLAKSVQGLAAGRQRHQAEEGLRLAGEEASRIAKDLEGPLATLLGGGAPVASSLPLGAAPVGAVASQPLDPISQRVSDAHGGNVPNVDPRIATGIVETANALGIDPVDLATTISYETGGTFDPTKSGPTTKWGQHRGLIQFGEPQAQQYGVNWEDPIGSQLGANGAVANYLRSRGVKPGMGLLDLYSTINAGSPGLYNRSDAAAGGAPGTVQDKVATQMAGHRAKAQALLTPYLSANAAPDASSGLMAYTPAVTPQAGALASAPFESAGLPQASVDPVIVATTPEEVLAAEMATGMVPNPLDLPENQMTFDYAPAQGGDYVDPLVSPQSTLAPAAPVGGLSGQVPANNPGIWGGGMDPNDPSTIPAMAGGTRDILPAGSPGIFPAAPGAIAQAAAPSPSPQGGGAPVGGGLHPAIVQALSSPYASPQTRQIAGMLLQQQMQAQDPRRAIELEKAQLELEAMRNPQVQKLINAGDGRLFNPNTNEWVIAPDIGAQTFRQATPQEAAAYGAAGGQFGPDGRFYPINPPSGMSIESDGQGGFRVVQGPGAGSKPLTEAQSKDAVYATRAAGSAPVLDQYDSFLASPTERAKEIDPTGVLRGTQSREYQMAKQAGDEFLQAILRKDTGAAITKDEMESYGRVYLPMPGDGPDVLIQKRVARARALEALKAGMPPDAILNVEKALEASQGAGDMPAPKSKAEMDALPSGTRFRAPDGSIRIKP